VRTILTLGARDYLLLGIVTEQFKLSGASVQSEILRTHDQVVSLLATKGLDYLKFKSALVPSAKRYECAFVFDSSKTTSGAYGVDIARSVIPLLERAGNCSISSGDLLTWDDDDLVWDLLTENIVLHKSVEVRLESLYCVYLNNQTKRMVESMHSGLLDFDAYIGYIPTQNSSPIRTYLSSTVSQAYVKVGRFVVGQHEEDADPKENWNLLGWPFENFGYEVKSVPETLYGLFLTYKIERPAPYDDLSDTRFSLNALSDNPQPLASLEVLVTEEKARYVADEKGESLARAGLRSITDEMLAGLISGKVEQNYIYMLQDKSDVDALLFDLILELPHERSGRQVRLMCSMNYRPDDGILKLVTLY
jgi:hypothetical protein